MEKNIKRMSLLTWIILSFTLCILASLALSALTYQAISKAQDSLIITKAITPEDNDKTSFSSYIYETMGKNLSVTGEIKNKTLFTLLEWLKIIAPTLIFGISIFLSAFLFYQRKLRKPIHVLQKGISCIEEQDLDFHISYESTDELGNLCRAFNTMRDKLNETFVTLWDEKEKQNILTRALAHDLRTPLAVIKGSSELIDLSLKNKFYDTEEMLSANAAIRENTERMEHYLESSREMLSLGDWQLKPISVTGSELSEKIRNLQQADNRVQLQVENYMKDALLLDEALIIRVLENIIANAMEYAEAKVTVTLKSREGSLAVLVKDDGKGFSADALKRAAAPYYRGDKGRRAGHMGLGLTVAQILTDCHQGELTWGNYENGAFVKVLFKSL